MTHLALPQPHGISTDFRQGSECAVRPAVSAVMNNPLTKIQAWRSRQQLRSLERWERIRAEGKAKFVRRTALTYGLTVVGATHLVDQMFFGGHESTVAFTLFKLILFVPFSSIAASDAWSTREAKYQDALSKASVKGSPGGALPPQNSP